MAEEPGICRLCHFLHSNVFWRGHLRWLRLLGPASAHWVAACFWCGWWRERWTGCGWCCGCHRNISTTAGNTSMSLCLGVVSQSWSSRLHNTSLSDFETRCIAVRSRMWGRNPCWSRDWLGLGKTGAGIMECIKWRQLSQSKRHPTIGIRQTEYHEALPSSANDEVRCDCTFADGGNDSWHSVCRVPMVEWRLDCENCRHLMVVGFHDTGPWSVWATVHVSDAQDRGVLKHLVA